MKPATDWKAVFAALGADPEIVVAELPYGACDLHLCWLDIHIGYWKSDSEHWRVARRLYKTPTRAARAAIALFRTTLLQEHEKLGTAFAKLGTVLSPEAPVVTRAGDLEARCRKHGVCIAHLGLAILDAPEARAAISGLLDRCDQISRQQAAACATCNATGHTCPDVLDNWPMGDRRCHYELRSGLCACGPCDICHGKGAVLEVGT